MSNYNGARKKTNFGSRNAKSQSTETGAKNRTYYTQNSVGGNDWGNTGRRPSRSTNDDGWGDVGRSHSNYTSDDLWGPLPSQPAVTENAWDRRSSRKNQRSHTNQGKKPVPLVGPNFQWDEDDYPALESRPPVENVWEKRKEKLEGRIAMEPTNMTEEELMIQKAIELSKCEAREAEERRRHIEEEYELQNQMLTRNPEFFSDFLTPEELVHTNYTNKSLEPEIADYQQNNFKNGCIESNSIWNVPEPVENQKQSQKVNNKKKRNKSTDKEDKLTAHNVWSDIQESDRDKQSESVFPEQIEYQKMQDNWPENIVSNNYSNKAEEYDSQFVNEDYDYSSANPTSSNSSVSKNDRKLHKDVQPKISKTIDMFGGWGSMSSQNSSLKPHKQERFESYDDFSSNSISNNKEICSNNWEQSKEMPELDGDFQFSNNSSKLPRNEKDQDSLNEEDSWNSKYSSNDDQYNNELKPSLYSHVENSIAASASSSFCNAAVANPSDSGASFLSKKSVPKDDDVMNSIVQDYASLAVKCNDSSAIESVPMERKSKDFFSSVAPLLNEDNMKLGVADFHQSEVDMVQNLSTQVVNPTSESEIMYSLNNTAPTEVSNKVQNDNIAGPWNNSDIHFSANPERNEINNSLFLPPENEPVNLHNHPVDPVISAPMQQGTPIPCQPNPMMGNFMMGLNPMMIHQMTMLNNPFFLQQLHQMQTYYTAMSMPFNSPLIAPMPIPHFNPIINNNVGSFLNNDPNLNVNPIPEQSVEDNTPIPPPSIPFENENERKSDTSPIPNIEFDNSWLSELLSEGAAHMDSYIPPPTMPVTNPIENPHPAPNVANKIDANLVQDHLQSAYQYEVSQNSDYDDRDTKQDGGTDVNINTRNVNSSNIPKSSVPEVVEATGWGEIDDAPKNNNASWNDDGWGDIDGMPKNSKASWENGADGWGEANATSSKSMINSSRYSSQKQATCRQPIRQPRQAFRRQ